jgi:hypothetical protein
MAHRHGHQLLEIGIDRPATGFAEHMPAEAGCRHRADSRQFVTHPALGDIPANRASTDRRWLL